MRNHTVRNQQILLQLQFSEESKVILAKVEGLSHPKFPDPLHPSYAMHDNLKCKPTIYILFLNLMTYKEKFNVFFFLLSCFLSSYLLSLRRVADN